MCTGGMHLHARCQWSLVLSMHYEELVKLPHKASCMHSHAVIRVEYVCFALKMDISANCSS